MGDAKPLAAQGFLIVRSPVKAEVLVQGVVRGFTNHKIISSCYTRNVRLRDVDSGLWLSPGQPVQITCMATTTIEIVPGKD